MDGACAMAGEEQCELASLAQLRNYSNAAPGRKFPDAVYVYRNIVSFTANRHELAALARGPCTIYGSIIDYIYTSFSI